MPSDNPIRRTFNKILGRGQLTIKDDSQQKSSAGSVQAAVVDNSSAIQKGPTFWRSMRFRMGIIVFFGYLCSYALRLDINFTVVCMVNQTALDLAKGHSNISNNTGAGDCPPVPAAKNGDLGWTKNNLGLVLSAYYWGYLITHVPGGWLAERWGSKPVLVASMLMQAIPAFFTPLCAYASPYAVVAMRILQGMGGGSFYPANHNMWASWAPPNERARLIALSYSGNQMAYIVTMPTSGALCHSVGWPSVFYLFGSLGMLWIVFWLIFGAGKPDESALISDVEKQYIVHCLSENSIIETRRKQLGTPWASIFKSKAVWALIIVQMTTNWGIYNLQTSIPTYMKEVLKFSESTNGLISALPYLVLYLMINIVARLADYLLTVLRTVTVRKLMMTLGMLMPAAFLVGMGFVPCTETHVAVILMCFGIGTLGFTYSGQMVNDLDIAYPFAGTILGIAYSFATISGIIAPYVTQVITQQQTADEWRVVFYINAGIYAVGLILYLILAEGTLQPWVYPYITADVGQGQDHDQAQQEEISTIDKNYGNIKHVDGSVSEISLASSESDGNNLRQVVPSNMKPASDLFVRTAKPVNDIAAQTLKPVGDAAVQTLKPFVDVVRPSVKKSLKASELSKGRSA